MSCSVEGVICNADEKGDKHTHTTQLQQVEDDNGAGDKQSLT